jgi:uncharacterized repeat protein (TIGR01451 family)
LEMSSHVSLKGYGLHTAMHQASNRRETRLMKPALFCLALIAGLLTHSSACAQSSVSARFANSNDVPGNVAFTSLLANPQWVGRVQPVKLMLPEKTIVSTWQGSWVDCEYADPTVATSIGPIYQVRIKGEFRTRSFDLFPTLEMVSCLNPPAELQLRFPVLVAISEDDIEQALAGRLVTKVIYVENPETALPYRQLCNGQQAFFDVTDLEDPIKTASRLGRPIAILRLGTRQPSDEEMSYSSATAIPLTVFPPQAARELEKRVWLVSYNNAAEEAKKKTEAPSVTKPAAFRLSPPAAGVSPQLQDPAAPVFQNREGLSLIDAPQPAAAVPQPQSGGVWSSDPCNLCPPPQTVGAAPGQQDFHRDEFLFDGGDKNFQVTVDQDWNVNGLDIEDTVGTFDTVEGNRHVVPSNRVAIYAPRFAAVRKIAKLSTESQPTRLARFEDTVELESTRGKDVSSTTLQQIQPQSNQAQLRARGFTDRTRGLTAENVDQPQRAEERTRSSNYSQHTRYRGFANSEGARQELAAVAARSWEDNLGLQIVANRRQAVIARDATKAHELVTIKTDDGESQLRILKQASTIAAKCGEEVEFTISFENIGARRIGNVTIIDNLTTRLEYVPDSANCSVEADFSSERNPADSLVLRWEIKQPLDVGQSGMIRFRCRVR